MHRQHGWPLKVCAARGGRWQRNTGKKGRGRGVPLFVKGFFFSLLNKMSTPLYRCQLHYRTAPVAASTWNYLLIKQLPHRGSRGAGYLPGGSNQVKKIPVYPCRHKHHFHYPGFLVAFVSLQMKTCSFIPRWSRTRPCQRRRKMGRAVPGVLGKKTTWV